MSKKEKLLARLVERPKDMTYEELVTVLSHCGFELLKPGASSARKFKHTETNAKLSFHEPHPTKIIKLYVIDQVIQKLEEMGYL